jgi:hypothetical protein
MQHSFIFDFPNFLLCVIAVLVVSKWAKLPNSFSLLLFFHCLIPFFLNDVLFPASYMPDQFKYSNTVNEIRSFSEVSFPVPTVVISSYMLAFIPLPFTETIKSLGFFNKFIFILLFGFLYRKKILTSYSAYFFLLYPSLALYTGLSLRDTLIVCFMILGAYYASQRKLVMFIFWIAPLLFIKFQNLLIMLPLVVFIIFKIDLKGINLRVGTYWFLVSMLFLILFSPLISPEINFFRLAMYLEDGGENPDSVPMIGGVTDFLVLGGNNAFYFLFKPFPWEAGNSLQLIQSFENLVIGILLVRITVKNWKVHKKHILFWFYFLIFSLTIYGLVVFNFGTAARYRFPFIVIYIIFICYSIKKNKLAMSKNNLSHFET